MLNKREYVMKQGPQELGKTLSTKYMMGDLSKESPKRQEIKIKGSIGFK